MSPSDEPEAAPAGGATATDDDVILFAESVSKNYGGVLALKEVTFSAHRGKVNVLVGENGAGKSTLMKILSGSVQPTSGRILLDGEPVDLASPRAAQAMGIGIIHQELSLFPNLSIAENMFAGREPRRVAGRFVDFAAERRQAAAVMKRLGQDLKPTTLVGRPAHRPAATGRDRQSPAGGRQDPHHGRADLGPVQPRGRRSVLGDGRPRARTTSPSSTSPTSSTSSVASATTSPSSATGHWSPRIHGQAPTPPGSCGRWSGGTRTACSNGPKGLPATSFSMSGA